MNLLYVCSFECKCEFPYLDESKVVYVKILIVIVKGCITSAKTLLIAQIKIWQSMSADFKGMEWTSIITLSNY